MTGIPLTFGIELEFVCLRPESLFDAEDDPVYLDCEDTGAGPAVWHKLLQNGIPAVVERSDARRVADSYAADAGRIACCLVKDETGKDICRLSKGQSRDKG